MSMKEVTTDHKGYLDMELLRFTTAGSVDDGKSTLIGRLLYDSKSIFADQMEAIEKASKGKGEEHVNLALLTDGLRAEREQGITIDVAYRYFATPKRKFIIADTPGHIQYTRNMVTGASTANLAIILVDARQGVIEQTKRHSYIASLLQIPHVVVCVNKMDLVDFSESVYEKVRLDFEDFSAKLDIKDVRFVPISALLGDNVVDRSKNMDWYGGSTLMHILENVHIGSDHNHIDARFPVQYVIRPMKAEHHDYRGYAGRVAGGIFREGEEVAVLPSGFTTKIKSIDVMGGTVKEAVAPMSVTLTLEDDIDISRGDMIVKVNNRPEVEQDIDLMVCWLSEKPLQVGGQIQH
jgi:sulfate adenylyltransferase subunit 1